MSHRTLPPVALEDALRLVDEATHADRAELQRLQLARFHALLAYAREHSPLLREKYAHLSATPALEEVPILLRSEGVDRFDDWLCDRQATHEGITRFLANPDNMLETYLGKYRVLTTSGTTGHPLYVLRDAGHVAVNAALVDRRFAGSSKVTGLPKLGDLTLRSCGILVAGGFHSAYVSALRTQKAYAAQGYAENCRFLPLDTPPEELIAALNDYQPQILGTYPSTLYGLIKYQQAGKLNIHPLVICCSAEQLSRETMLLAEKVFGCPVLDNYCSTEGGEISMLCRENHMHLNMDWLIVEPVDANKKPVPPGTKSAGVLLTNLANCVQPMIRYYVSDSITMFEEDCPCGSHLPFMEIEGRNDDVMELAGKEGPIFITPVQVLTFSLHDSECVECQILQRSRSEVEVRFTALNQSGRKALGEAIHKYFQKLVGGSDSGVIVRMSDEAVIHGKSGKLRLVVPNAPRQ